MKTLTLGQLHAALGKLIDGGLAKRTPVAVHKESFMHPLEDDGCMILDVQGIEAIDFEAVLQADDDGGIRTTKAGLESTRRTVVLYGDKTLVKLPPERFGG